ELEPVEPEVFEQMALKGTRGGVADPAPAELRVDREAAEARDPAAPVADLEVHRPGPPAVALDHEQAERLGLAVGALDLCEHGVPVRRPDRSEVRLHLLVGQEVDEEV